MKDKINIDNKKNAIIITVFVVLVILAISLLGSTIFNKIGKDDVITSSQLEKAIGISQLSTAEFIYNGVAEKYKEKKPEEVDFYISYEANVKVGFQIEDVKFDINVEDKTIMPVLPEIMINAVTLDEGKLSYIPKNPDIALKDIINICKDDAMEEANKSEELYQIAEDNTQAAIEALLSPILNKAEYSIVWN